MKIIHIFGGTYSKIIHIFFNSFKELSAAASVMQSSSKELSILVADRV